MNSFYYFIFSDIRKIRPFYTLVINTHTHRKVHTNIDSKTHECIKLHLHNRYNILCGKEYDNRN